MTEQKVFLGYAVEKMPERGKGYELAYQLTGPRGAVYGLVRNVNKPDMMFAVNGRNGNCVAVKGNSWFTDRKGYLQPVY